MKPVQSSRGLGRAMFCSCVLMLATCTTSPGCIAHVYQEYLQDVQVRVVHRFGGAPIPSCQIETLDRPYLERAITDAAGESVLQIGSTSYQELLFHSIYSQPDMVTGREFTLSLRESQSIEEICGAFRPGTRLDGESLALEIVSIDGPRTVKKLERKKRSETSQPVQTE